MRPDALYAYVWSPVDVSKQQGEVFVAPFAVRLPFVSEPFHDGVAIPVEAFGDVISRGQVLGQDYLAA